MGAQHLLLPVHVSGASGDIGAEEVWAEDMDGENHDYMGASMSPTVYKIKMLKQDSRA